MSPSNGMKMLAQARNRFLEKRLLIGPSRGCIS